jgi:hypothetical protein
MVKQSMKKYNKIFEPSYLIKEINSNRFIIKHIYKLDI